MPTKRRRGEAAKHIEEVLPKDFVLDELFGFENPGSLRKLMSRHGVYAVVGYRYDDVRRVFEHWDPDRAWSRAPQHAKFEPDEEYS